MILISLDGFKAEYLDRFDLPHLRKLAARGALARNGPGVPVVDLPQPLLAGHRLHPQAHGIVNNRFYDPARKSTYVYTTTRS